MKEAPKFYGLGSCNLQPHEQWDRENFPRTFSVALCNYLGDSGEGVNLVSYRHGACKVENLPVCRVYGTGKSPSELSFDFDSVFEPHLELASGVPESDLVIRNGTGSPIGRLDMQASVIPDASTKGLPPELSGPEVTFRTRNLKNLALSMAFSLMCERERALDILDDIQHVTGDWGDWGQVSNATDDILRVLDRLESELSDRQSPCMLQSVWRSEEDGPLLADDAMDVFVWTDYALSRLFLDSTRRSSDGSPTRPIRCAVRLYRVLEGILSGGHPDLDMLMLETQYGIQGNRELMVNGKATNRYMACDRLTRPAVGSNEMPMLASKGFESMIVPERRLDSSVYYAVRAVRG